MHLLKNTEAGFTLVEVMIGVMVLALGLMSAAAMQTRAVDGSNAANRRIQRVTASEKWLEDIISRPVIADRDLAVNDLFTDNCSSGRECNDGTWFTAPEEFAGKAHRVEYRVRTATPLPNLVTIDVRAVPSGGGESEQRRKQVLLSYVRSTRWN